MNLRCTAALVFLSVAGWSGLVAPAGTPAVTGPVVDWDLGAKPSPRRKGRRDPGPQIGHVLDVSVTGAAIVASLRLR